MGITGVSLPLKRIHRARFYQEGLTDDICGEHFKSLPVSAQRNRSILFTRIAAAEQLQDGGAEYGAAVADFQKYYPHDPALDLLLISFQAANKKYAEAHQSLDRLMAFVGDDAHLHCEHALVYLKTETDEDVEKAGDEYRKAVALEPENSSAHWGLVSIYVKQKDNAKIAGALTDIQTQMQIGIADLTKLQFYADFVKSPEYKTWMAAQPKK